MRTYAMYNVLQTPFLNLHIAEFDSTVAVGEVYWASPDGDIPFAGFNGAACEHTTCPIQKSVANTYNYTLPISKRYPVVSGLCDSRYERECN